MLQHTHPHERMGLYLVFGFVISILALSKLLMPDITPINIQPKAATKTVATAAEFKAAIAAALPGDVIEISGTIQGGGIVITKNGTQAAPITITGGTIQGGTGRMVEIRDSSWLVFNRITFDGANTADTTLYMLNSKYNIFDSNTFKNAGGECFRMKAGSHNNTVLGNTIESCGRTGWAPPANKNGEGIYIGTAPEQLTKNVEEAAKSTAADKSGYFANPDTSDLNRIALNIIRPGHPENTHGSECVDIKEGAKNNFIQTNTCSGELDKNSGGMESRGEQNIFYENTFNSIICGAGIRLGGDDRLTQGIGNFVIGNKFDDYNNANSICPLSATTEADKLVVHGAVKVEAPNQGYMCGNTAKDTILVSGAFKSQINTTEFIGACDSTRVRAVFGDKQFGVPAPITPTPPPTAACLTSSGTWQNQPITSQNNQFTGTISLKTDTVPTDLVVGFSKNPATTFSDLAVALRMNTEGYIDIRNGSSYSGIRNTITQYDANSLYDIELVVNMLTHTFEAKMVLIDNGSTKIYSPIFVGNAFFRTEQASVTDLNYINIFRNTSATGTGSVCNIKISGSTTVTPTLPPTLTPTTGATITPTTPPGAPCPFKKEGDADCKKDSLGLDMGLVDFNIWRGESFNGCSQSNLAGCGAEEDGDTTSPMDADFNYPGSGNLPEQTTAVVDIIDFNIWRNGYFAHKNPTATPTTIPTSLPTATPTPTVPPVNTPTPTQATTGCTYPSQKLNLTNWKLTLPILVNGSNEISNSNLPTYTIDPWFKVNANCTGVQFRAHTSSSTTTSNSSYPRSELREMVTDGSTEISWSSSSGTHTMTLDEAITAIPAGKKHIVSAQIHDSNDDVITIRLEYPKLYIDLNGVSGPILDPAYTLGKRFTVKFVVNSNKTSVYYNNSSTPAYVYSRSYSGAYFKAGAYTQSNCSTESAAGATCSTTNYGEVNIYSLSVSHQ